jgi:hypothetical protein
LSSPFHLQARDALSGQHFPNRANAKDAALGSLYVNSKNKTSLAIAEPDLRQFRHD